MKVVRPEWLMESISAGTLLPWRKFVIGAGERPDGSQGKVMPTQSVAIESITNKKSRRTHMVDSTSVIAQVTHPTTMESVPNPSSDAEQPHRTDHATNEAAVRIPSYAAHSSNLYATRKMEDPQWRAENTAVAPGFIEGFYRNSRLHHLSTWKAELQELVARATECVENGAELEELTDPPTKTFLGTSMGGIQFHKPTSPEKGKAVATDRQTIMHCDFDAFFVSAGLVDRPHLKGKPVVVCHSQGGQGGAASTSEIASSSYEARTFGVRNGMRYALI